MSLLDVCLIVVDVHCLCVCVWCVSLNDIAAESAKCRSVRRIKGGYGEEEKKNEVRNLQK